MSREAQCVDIRFHEVFECLVDHAVSLERVRPGKPLRHDSDMEVTAPVSSTRMPYVRLALVRNLEFLGRKCRFEPGSNGG
jgi:hypothetical protein